MTTQTIGVIDSGVGGLSIWKDIVAFLPAISTVYIADSANAPYGGKSQTEILQLATRLVIALQKQNIRTIVIACNTMTVSSLHTLREQFPNMTFIGTVPAIKVAVETSKSKRIGILSTEVTANSDYFKELLSQHASDLQITNIGTNRLVPFIERGDVLSQEFIAHLREELQPFLTSQIDTLVLGCTHFPLIAEQITKILGSKVLLIDSGKGVAKRVKSLVGDEEKKIVGKEKSHTFYTTGEITLFEKLVRQYAHIEGKKMVFARIEV